MKVIFLDFDGVLNSDQYDSERDQTADTNIDESRLPLLKQIVDATGAKIVLSTTWRCYWEENPNDCDAIGIWMNALFAKYGLEIFGKTPRLSFRAGRKAEVLSWLEFAPEQVDSFVIIDDYAFGWEELTSRLVKTSAHIGRGLELCHVEKAIDILTNDCL